MIFIEAICLLLELICFRALDMISGIVSFRQVVWPDVPKPANNWGKHDFVRLRLILYRVLANFNDDAYAQLYYYYYLYFPHIGLLLY